MRSLPRLAVVGVVGLTLSLALAQSGQQEPILQLAALTIGGKADLASVPDETEPKSQLKRQVGAFPMVDRSRKGDPYIGLRPSLEGRLTIR